MPLIITDTTCDFSLEHANNIGVRMLSLGVTFGDHFYKEKIDITNKEFYEKLEASKNIPTTNLINPSEFVDIYNAYPDEDIIVLPIAKKLSGTFQSAIIAKDIVERDNIHVLDTKTVTCGLGLLVTSAVKYCNENLSTEEIVEKLKADIKQIQIVAVFDTLKYLIKGGRLSKVEGAIGSALNIKPILSIANGELETIGKCRGNKAAYREIIRIVQEDLPIDDSREIFYGSSNAPDLLNTFREVSPYTGINFDVGCVIGTHAGPGCVEIAYFKK